MKILKRPENVIYDTENPDKMEFNSTRIDVDLTTPLHHLTTKTDWDFLSEFFKPQGRIQHPIFNDFGNSFYYCVKV